MAVKPKRSDLELDPKSSTGKDGRSHLVRTGYAKSGTSRASKPRKSATKSKSLPRKSARAKPGSTEAKPIEAQEGAKVMRDRDQATGERASRLIDQRIGDLGGWRAETLGRMRALILEADPEMIEEWKWRGTPVWSHHGIVCTGEAYTKVVKLTFARGASIPDPSQLFNSSLQGSTRRAIDIHEGEKVDAHAFKLLVKAAVARNGPTAKSGAKARPRVRSGQAIRVRER